MVSGLLVSAILLHYAASAASIVYKKDALEKTSLDRFLASNSLLSMILTVLTVLGILLCVVALYLELGLLYGFLVFFVVSVLAPLLAYRLEKGPYAMAAPSSLFALSLGYPVFLVSVFFEFNK